MARSTRRLAACLLWTTLAAACASSAASRGDDVPAPGEDAADMDADVLPDLADPATRPTGWSEASHAKGVPADYDAVFDDTRVHRLDLVLPAATYAAMLAQLADHLDATATGPRGTRGPPQAAIDACVGLEGGEPCAFVDAGKTIEGTCFEPPGGQAAACAPPGTGTPSAGLGFDPLWADVTVRYEGREWPHVAMRFKGYSSLRDAWRMGSRKLSFRLNFDRNEGDFPAIEDQRFWGFKKLVVNNNWRDPSLLRDKVASDLLREAGVPSARCAFYEVWVDAGEGAVYWGLYTAFEDPSDDLLDAQLGGDGGNLYEAVGANLAKYAATGFEKKTNEEDTDASDLQTLIAALNADRTDAAAWRAGLEARLDVAGFLRWLAANTVMANWDSYGIAPHNYLLYADPGAGGRFRWIPSDLNEALRTTGTPRPVLSLDLADVAASWPLIRFTADDPTYAAAYRAEVATFVAGAFESARVLARLDGLHTLIAPSVAAESAPFTVLASPDLFDTSLDGGADALKPHVTARHAAAASFLGE